MILKPEQIREGNIELAKFMGCKVYGEEGKEGDVYVEGTYIFRLSASAGLTAKRMILVDKLTFHKDWNALMDVVKKLVEYFVDAINVAKISIMLSKITKTFSIDLDYIEDLFLATWCFIVENKEEIEFINNLKK